MRYANDDDTIVAPVTPPGQSGVGIVRISGDNALPILEKLSRMGGGSFEPRRATLAKVYDPRNESLIDRAIVFFYPSPASYTGEDVVEVSAHGNPVILAAICEMAIYFGARMAEPGEFTKRAFLKGKMDLSQAEAVQELIVAKTRRAARAAQRRLAGELGQTVKNIRELLMNCLVNLEAAVDFPEEELEILSEGRLRELLYAAISRVEDLLETFRVGRVLTEGAKIAIAGKPNVGKSSLLNRLLRAERAIVSPYPGTTRDFISEISHIRGIPLTFVDTAGIRADAGDAIESEGVDRSRRMIEEADLVLFVIDGSQEISGEDEVTQRAIEERSYLLVMNKKDLGIINGFKGLQRGNGFSGSVAVSAKTGEDMGTLEELIFQAIIGDGKGTSEEVVVGNLRQKEMLEKAKGYLDAAIKGCENNDSPELISLEVRDGASSLGEIIGDITTEDILEKIFSSFCIGK